MIRLLSEEDSLYQLDWHKYLFRNCCCAAKDEAKSNRISLVYSSPSPSKDLSAGIIPLLRLSTLRLLLPVLKTMSVCTAPTVGIIGKNLTGGSGSEPNEISSKKETKSSITGSPTKLTDGSNSSLSSSTSIDIKVEASLSLSSATSHQASTSRENSYGKAPDSTNSYCT
ncbi:hypothetical protein AYI68_g7784 [Smittium mucronatum]|uniref:Uncharacterized protein n=1 Tax=Smittium mucronatum TaxID=133383 RepID=A0A1R0GMP7_9FUNG|nr:hypothetical protein AYI68_g7784 [Smittium mucronatum]